MIRKDELRGKILPILAPYGVKRVALFGSVARGEDTAESDVDLLVEFEEPRPKPLGLFTWVRLEHEMSEQLARRVEMVSERGLNKYVRPYVEADMIVLYEKA